MPERNRTSVNTSVNKSREGQKLNRLPNPLKRWDHSVKKCCLTPIFPIDTGLRDDQNYFFRVRTVMDENGKIKSALYGKIIGDIAVDVFHSKTPLILFSYCLNPNLNDRNMEFDPKKNLFGRLSPTVQIRTP